MRKKRALFLGRFQPPSIAHAATVETILQEWDELTIGVVRPDILNEEVDPRWASFITETSPGFAPDRYFFEPELVAKMWQAFSEAKRLRDRLTCTACPRPFYPSFSTMFPAEEYDLVYPLPAEGDTGSDLTKAKHLQDLLNRRVYHVKPPFMLHNTEIRRRVAAGDDINLYLALGVAELLPKKAA